nr:hypothetical protein [Tanacetum cinerariifolium]
MLEDPYAYVDDVFPAKEQPLPAAASPTAESPGYILEFDLDEDPEEDDDENPEPQSPTLSFNKEDAERFLAMPIPPPSPLTPLSSPLPQIPSPPLPASPPILPIPLPAASPPLQLLSSDCRADRPEVTLPPQKRLSIVHCPGYETRESSVAALTRPIEGRRADYGFVDSVEAEIRRRRAEDIGYGIRDTWIDSRDVVEEEALTTFEWVNTRVIELAAEQEQDTQDIYRVMEDTQENGTKECGPKAKYKHVMQTELVMTTIHQERVSGVGNKMHKAFPLPGESSHWQYKFPLRVEGVPTARRMEIPLPGVCTAMMKKLPVKEKWQLH